MNKYQVLWFDDDFQPLIQNPSEGQKLINYRRGVFIDDVEQARKSFDVIPVASEKEYYEKLKAYGRFQAVIFDLKGLDNENIDNDYVITGAIEAAKKLPLSIYIYSNNTDSEKFDLTLKPFKDNDHCFKKGHGVDDLCEKIVSDLEQEYQHFSGHEECLSLFNNGYLDSANMGSMVSILKNADERQRDLNYLPYNDMRIILENMLNTLTDCDIIKGGGETDFDTFNSRLWYLSEKCDFTKGKVDFNKPTVPFSDCRIEVKYTLKFLGDITNRYSHYLEENPKYLKEGETVLEYNQYILQMAYPAFFIAMKWYSGFMANKY